MRELQAIRQGAEEGVREELQRRHRVQVEEGEGVEERRLERKQASLILT